MAVYFEVVNKSDNKSKFQTMNYKKAEKEKQYRERQGIACIIERKKVKV